MVPHIAAWCGNRAHSMNYKPVDPLLSIKQVMRVTSLSRASIARFMAAKRFPQSVALSPGRRAWRASEISAWNESPLDWGRDPFDDS